MAMRSKDSERLGVLQVQQLATSFFPFIYGLGTDNFRQIYIDDVADVTVRIRHSSGRPQDVRIRVVRDKTSPIGFTSMPNPLKRKWFLLRG